METKKDAFYKGLFTCLKWLGLWLLAHVIGQLLFGMILGPAASQREYFEPETLHITYVSTLIFDAAYLVVFVLIQNRILSMPPSVRNEIRQAAKEPGFSPLRTWRKLYLRDTLYAVILFSVLQLPFLFFFSKFGLSFSEAIFMDKFYLMDAGFYLVTQSAVLGWLLSSFYFALVLFLFHLLSVRRVAAD